MSVDRCNESNHYSRLVSTIDHTANHTVDHTARTQSYRANPMSATVVDNRLDGEKGERKQQLAK